MKSKILVILAIIIFLFLSFVFLLKTNFARDFIANNSALFISKIIKKPVEIEKFDYQLVPPSISAKNLKIYSKDKEYVLLSIEDILMSFKYFQIFSGKFIVNKLKVNQITVNYHVTKKYNNKINIKSFNFPILVNNGEINNISATVFYLDNKISSNISIPNIKIRSMRSFFWSKAFHRIFIPNASAQIDINNKTIPIENISLNLIHKKNQLDLEGFNYSLLGKRHSINGFIGTSKKLDLTFLGELNLSSLNNFTKYPAQGSITYNIHSTYNKNLKAKALATIENFKIKRYKIKYLAADLIYKNDKIEGDFKFIPIENNHLSAKAEIYTKKPFNFNTDLEFTNFTLANILEIFSIKSNYIDLNIFSGEGSLNGTAYPFNASGSANLYINELNLNTETGGFTKLRDIAVTANVDVDKNKLVIKDSSLNYENSKIYATSIFHFPSSTNSMDLYFYSNNLLFPNQPFFGHRLDINGDINGRIFGKYKSIDVITNLDLQSVYCNNAAVGMVNGKILYSRNTPKLIFDKIKIIKNGSSIDLRGDYDFQSKQINYQFFLKDYELGNILSIFKHDNIKANGPLNGFIKLQGKPEKPEINSSLSAEKLTIYGENFQKTTIDIEKDKNITIVSLRSKKDNANIFINGDISDDKNVNLNITSNELEYSSIETFKKYNIPLSSKLTINSNIFGKYPNLNSSGKIIFTKTLLSNVNYKNSTLNYTLQNKKVHIESKIFGDSINARVDVDFHKKYPFILEANLIEFDAHQIFSQLFKKQDLGFLAKLSSILILKGNLKDLSYIDGNIFVKSLIIDSNGTTLKNDQEFSMDIENGKLNIPSTNFSVLDSSFLAEGFITLSGKSSILLNGSLNLSTLDNFINEATGIKGNSSFTLKFSGDLKNPDIDGSLKIINASFIPQKIPTVFSNINLDASLNKKKILITKLDGAVKDGSIAGTGELSLNNFRPEYYNVNLLFNNIAFTYPKDVDLKIDGNLLIAGPLSNLKINGEIDLQKLHYKKRVNWRSNLISFGKNPSIPMFFDQKKDKVKFDIIIKTKNDILIENNLMEGKLSGDLRLVGSLLNYGYTGQLKISEGILYFRNNEFEISSGTLNFTDPDKDIIEFNINAEIKIQDYKIFANITGNNLKFTSTFTSEPILVESDIISLLEVGHIASEAGRTQAGAWEAAAIITGKAQDIIEKELNTYVKFIKTFQVVPTFSESSKTVEPQLLVGSRLTKKIELNYKTFLTNIGEQEAALEYDINKNFSLISNWKGGGINNMKEIGLDLKFKFEFK